MLGTSWQGCHLAPCRVRWCAWQSGFDLLIARGTAQLVLCKCWCALLHAKWRLVDGSAAHALLLVHTEKMSRPKDTLILNAAQLSQANIILSVTWEEPASNYWSLVHGWQLSEAKRWQLVCELLHASNSEGQCLQVHSWINIEPTTNHFYTMLSNNLFIF